MTVAGYGSLDNGASAKQQLDQLNSLADGAKLDCSAGPGGGYSDISAGTRVSITDGAGKLLATASLEGGVQSLSGCTFTFRANVPDSDFYKIEVGSRGALSYSKADLGKRQWRVAVKLG